MHLADVPLILVLLGLVAYMVLGGADFGTGVWELAAHGRRGEHIRDRIHDAMGPVWEANHVWLIFVLVITWTAYPTAFASIVTTLSVPFFIAAVGIILRGSSYALRAAARTPRERDVLDDVFAVSSILTPFALGAIVGAIAAGRVPVGNAAGDLLGSWLTPTSLVVGAIAVAAAAHLAAVYLSADSARANDAGMVAAFGGRALLSGVVAGALAIAGLVIVHADAPRLFDRLVSGPGLIAVVVSGAAGVVTLLLIATGRSHLARYTAAAAVAAVIAGWGAAQQPDILPGLTVQAAAAGDGTLVAVIVAVGIGAVVLVPSLVLLFSLYLHGRFDLPPEGGTSAVHGARAGRAATSWAPLLALAVAGTALTVIDATPWMVPVGVAGLVLFVAMSFVVLASGDLEAGDHAGAEPGAPRR
jgi:cytochrome d ubiquinol oxidase subunit II